MRGPEEAASEAQCAFDIGRLEPGDILLGRVPMDLNDPSTWDSHLIQSLTRSRFSFSALHLGNGVFIEAVGSGVARLPVTGAGIRDARNVRVLRARNGGEWIGRRAAAAGQRYLQRGFCRAVSPHTQCTAFHDVKRAAVGHSGMVASAYAEADFSLFDNSLFKNKSPYEIFPGDFLQSALLEDVTATVLHYLPVPSRPTFYVDDDSRCLRVHHWEIVTQLKAVCNYEVRRILDIHSQKPSSLRELEAAIAEKKWSALDEALCRCWEWYRYAAVYQLKHRHLFGDTNAGDATAPTTGIARLLPAALDEDRLSGALFAVSATLHLLEIERSHWLQQRDYYGDLLRHYESKSFAYMHNVFEQQIAVGERLFEAMQQQKNSYQQEARRRGLRLKIA